MGKYRIWKLLALAFLLSATLVRSAPLVFRSDTSLSYENNSGTSHLFINGSTGNMGIGTATPNGKFDVMNGGEHVGAQSDAAPGAGQELVLAPLSGSVAGILFQHNAVDSVFMRSSSATRLTTLGANAGTFLAINNSNGNVGIGTASPGAKLSFGTVSGADLIRFWDGGAGSSYGYGIQSGELQAFIASGGHFSFNSGGNLQTSGTNELMRITSTGNVGINTTSPTSFTLQVAGSVGPNADNTVDLGSSAKHWASIYYGAASCGGTCPSDYRLKQNITPITGILANFTQLQPVTYEWRVNEFPDRHFGRGQQTGLIAQEVQKVFPTLVSVDRNGYLGVNYGTELSMISIEAIKELDAKTVQHDTSGKVGINTTSPQNTLTVVGDANVTSTLFAGSCAASGCTDIAELYPSTPDVAAGDVVCRGTDGNATPCTDGLPLLGVVSTHPAIIIDGDHVVLGQAEDANSTSRPIALKGRVPVKVLCPVTAGDYLIPSSTPGYAVALNTSTATVADSLRVMGTSIETCTTGNSTLMVWLH
jgi:hypothetical protein